MPATRARAQVTLIEYGSKIQISSTSASNYARPSGWQYLQGWIEDGWVPIDLTGNGERDCALVLELRWGSSMRQVAFISVKEKDDGIKIKARTDDVPNLPIDWDVGLASWTQAGWDLVQITGNREHGWGWLMVKTSKDDDK